MTQLFHNHLTDVSTIASHAGVDQVLGRDRSGATRFGWCVAATGTEAVARDLRARGRATERLRHRLFGGTWIADAAVPLLIAPACDGTSLRDYVAATGPLSLDQALTVGLALAEGLMESHALGFAHGRVGLDTVLFDGQAVRLRGLDPVFDVPDGVRSDLMAIGEVLRSAAHLGDGPADRSLSELVHRMVAGTFESAGHVYAELHECSAARTRPMQAASKGLPYESIGGFKLERELGRGGFARVYLASRGAQRVALKVLMRGGGQDAAEVRRFRREARLAAMLKSPHTIRLLEHGEDQSVMFLALEYIDGETLADRVKRGPMPISEVLALYRAMLASLDEAHRLGILHRDIKPANIMLDARGNARLLDFGIAKLQGELLQATSNLTATGVVLGTPRYISPENLLGWEITAATDIYSLALVIYEALTGEPAVRGDSSFGWIAQHLDDHPFLLPSGDWPPGLQNAVEMSLRKSVTERPGSVAAVLSLLDTAAPLQRATPRPQPVAVPPAPREPATRAVETGEVGSRNEPLIVGLVVVLVLVVLTGAYTAYTAYTMQGEPSSESVVRRTPVRVPTALTRTADAGQRVEVVPMLPSDSGCGGETPYTGLREHSAIIGLRRVKWQVYVPPGYDPSVKHPTILLFHSVGRTPRNIFDDTRISSLADKHGAVIVLPDDGSTVTPWLSFDPTGTLEAFEQTKRALCLDPSRLYAIGHGVGGRAVENLPCNLDLTAIATTSFRGRASHDSLCDRAKEVPYIHFAPLKDGFSPVKGGTGCSATNKQTLEQKREIWLKRHGCKGESTVVLREKTGVCRAWQCDVPFELCELEGGRRWSTMPERVADLPQCDGPPNDFPFLETIWAFFERSTPESR